MYYRIAQSSDRLCLKTNEKKTQIALKLLKECLQIVSDRKNVEVDYEFCKKNLFDFWKDYYKYHKIRRDEPGN